MKKRNNLVHNFLSGRGDVIKKSRDPGRFFHPKRFPLKTAMAHLIEMFDWSWSSDVAKPKNVSKKLTEKHKQNFLNFSENAKRKVTRK